MDEFERAKDKIMMGAERRSMVMSEEEKKHHRLPRGGPRDRRALSVPEHDPVYKVTIIPRGRALGVTMFLPEEDRYSYQQAAAREPHRDACSAAASPRSSIFGADGVTTGASNDIERATELARNMVTKWGLSDELGPLTYTEEERRSVPRPQVTQHKQVSDVTAHAIDEEVRRVIDATTTARRSGSSRATSTSCTRWPTR